MTRSGRFASAKCYYTKKKIESKRVWVVILDCLLLYVNIYC